MGFSGHLCEKPSLKFKDHKLACAMYAKHFRCTLCQEIFIVRSFAKAWDLCFWNWAALHVMVNSRGYDLYLFYPKRPTSRDGMEPQEASLYVYAAKMEFFTAQFSYVTDSIYTV